MRAVQGDCQLVATPAPAVAEQTSPTNVGMALASGLAAVYFGYLTPGGFLFRTTEKIRAEYPQLPAYETYGELLDAIRRTVNTAHPV